MAEGGGFEPPEGVNLLRFSRPPQSAALPSLRRPISWRHENGGASGTRTHVAAVQRRSSPAELWPRENHGRSGGDRTRGHLLPKQVRYLCATLRCPCPAKPRHARPGRGKSQEPPARCRRPPAGGPQKACRKFGGRDPDGHGPGHDDSLCSFPSSPSQPQSRQRPEVGRGRCRSRGRKEKPGLRLPQCRAS